MFALYLIPTILLLPSLILHFSSVEPFHRGYFCEDTSIKYPFVEQQTIPAYLCLMIWIILCIVHFSIAFLTQKSWKMLFNTVYKLILGFSLCMLITDVSKFSLGRLRPHFLTVCNPTLEDVCYQLEDTYIEVDDSDYSYTEVHHQKYVVENDTCTGNKDLMREARLSFVSGHSSTSFYMAVFLFIFMNKYISLWILRTLLQLAHIILAFWISITRINDYMHHPEDVIMGSIIGIVCAYIIMYREDHCDQEHDKQKNMEPSPEIVAMTVQ
jgi:phosphatidate phosphatase